METVTEQVSKSASNYIILTNPPGIVVMTDKGGEADPFTFTDGELIYDELEARKP